MLKRRLAVPGQRPGKGAGVDSRHREEALTRAADLLGCQDASSREVLIRLWDEAFDQGKLAALDELQDRFCVCMK